MDISKNIGLLYYFIPFLKSPSIIENKLSIALSLFFGQKSLKIKIRNLPPLIFNIVDYDLMINFVGTLAFSTNYSLVDKKYVELSFDFNHKFRIPIYEHSEEDKNLIELLYLCSRDGADFITDKNENITEFRNKTLKIYEDNGKKIIETFSGIKFYLDSIHPGNTIMECFTDDIHTIRYSDTMTGKTVVDVGAECGDTPLYYASKGAKVFAFEPILSNFNSMLRNISLNPTLSKKIVPINAAVGKDGTLNFFQSPETPTIGSSFVYNRYGDKAKTTEVQGYSFERIIKEFNINTIDLLKLDCKGCDIYLNKEILKHVVEVKIEYMSQFTSKKLEELKQLLETSGFVCTIYRTSPFSRISNKLNGHIYGKKIK